MIRLVINSRASRVQNILRKTNNIRFKEKERNHVLWDDAECTLTNETSGATRDRVISYLNLRCHAHVEEKGRVAREKGDI